jgi:Zn-dependent peptidase ImmA (M78 family)
MARREFKMWAEETALSVREELSLSSAAPLDPFKLAEWLSVPVVVPEELHRLPDECKDRLLIEHSNNWSAVTITIGKEHLIVLNSARAVVQRKIDLAHELAHVILHHESSDQFATPGGIIALRIYSNEEEEEACWLAACLLLPRDALFYIRRRGLTDEEACAEYGITEATLRFRCRVRGDVRLRRTKRFNH